jgi:hypothetical protein
MTEAIKSFGVRWEHRQQNVRKRDIATDVARFSIMAAVGLGLRIYFPRATILTTLVTPAFAAGYLLDQKKLSHPDTFIASAMKTSFLLGAFLTGVGAGTTYRGIETLIKAAKINDIASGLHLISYSVGVTFPVANALIKLSSDWLKDETRAKAGADYLKAAVEIRIPGNSSSESDVDRTNIGTPWSALKQVCWFIGLSSVLEKEKINDESISHTAEVIAGTRLAYRGLRILTNLQNKGDLDDERQMAPFAALDRIQYWCAYDFVKTKRTIKFQSHLTAKRPLEQIKSLIKLYPAIDKNILVKENADYKSYILKISLDQLSDLLQACVKLQSKCGEYEQLTDDQLSQQIEGVHEDLNSLEKQMRAVANLLQERDDLGVDKNGVITEKHSTKDADVAKKLQSLIAYSPDKKALSQLKEKVERERRKKIIASSQETTLGEDFTECMGTRWNQKDYLLLATFFKMPLEKLDEKLSELGLNTRKELIEKGILLRFDEREEYKTANGQVDDQAIKTEQQKRLHRHIGLNPENFLESQYVPRTQSPEGSQLLQKIRAVCAKIFLMGCLGFNITLAPGYFAAGIAIALLSRRISIVVENPARQRSINFIQLLVSMFFQQMIANFDELSLRRQAQVVSLMTHDNYLYGSTNDYRLCAIFKAYLLTRDIERGVKKIYAWATRHPA